MGLSRAIHGFNGVQLKAVCVDAGMCVLKRDAYTIIHQDFVEGIAIVQTKKTDFELLCLTLKSASICSAPVLLQGRNLLKKCAFIHPTIQEQQPILNPESVLCLFALDTESRNNKQQKKL